MRRRAGRKTESQGATVMKNAIILTILTANISFTANRNISQSELKKIWLPGAKINIGPLIDEARKLCN
jgi:hypothetical protein